MELPAFDAASFVASEKALIQNDAPEPVRAEPRPETPECGQAVRDPNIDENAAQIEQDGGRNGAPVRKP